MIVCAPVEKASWMVPCSSVYEPLGSVWFVGIVLWLCQMVFCEFCNVAMGIGAVCMIGGIWVSGCCRAMVHTIVMTAARAMMASGLGMMK